MMPQEPLWKWDEDEHPDTDPIVDLAIAYVGARITAEEASGSHWMAAQLDVDACWHDLQVAVLGSCRMCDPGTCPAMLNIRQRLLVGNAYRPIVNTPPL